MTERFKYLDIASGIMIIWVLLYHALYPMLELNILSKIPFLYFFMPWFFYKSGYMFNVNTNKELFRKDFRKLLLPFAFWSRCKDLACYRQFGTLFPAVGACKNRIYHNLRYAHRACEGQA